MSPSTNCWYSGYGFVDSWKNETLWTSKNKTQSCYPGDARDKRPIEQCDSANQSFKAYIARTMLDFDEKQYWPQVKNGASQWQTAT